jgi:hypothetical protein
MTPACRRGKSGKLITRYESHSPRFGGFFVVWGLNSGYKHLQDESKTSLSNGDVKMVDKRKIHRRRFIPVTRTPLHTPSGDLITSERRMLPTRRLNDIAAEEITIVEFISGFSSHCT